MSEWKAEEHTVKVTCESAIPVIVESPEKLVVDFVCFCDGPNKERNAILIAAAPAMLSALSRSIEVMELAFERAANYTEAGVIAARIDNAKAAIARAEGKA